MIPTNLNVCQLFYLFCKKKLFIFEFRNAIETNRLSLSISIREHTTLPGNTCEPYTTNYNRLYRNKLLRTNNLLLA